MAFTTSPFYHAGTRKIIVAFGVLFRDIKVQRPDGSEIKVPLVYGSKQKWYSRLRNNPNLLQNESTILPRIGFALDSFEYDSERKLSSVGKLAKRDPNDENSLRTIFQPVPWNLLINLYVWSKTVDDGLQIIEQIIPFFKPSFNITIAELSNEFQSLKDIPITLTSISATDEYEGSYEDFRVSEWDLMFSVRMNYHGPVRSTGLIKKVIVDTHIPFGIDVADANTENSPTDVRYNTWIEPEEATIVDEYEILESLEFNPETPPVPEPE